MSHAGPRQPHLQHPRSQPNMLQRLQGSCQLRASCLLDARLDRVAGTTAGGRQAQGHRIVAPHAVLKNVQQLTVPPVKHKHAALDSVRLGCRLRRCCCSRRRTPAASCRCRAACRRRGRCGCGCRRQQLLARRAQAADARHSRAGFPVVSRALAPGQRCCPPDGAVGAQRLVHIQAPAGEESTQADGCPGAHVSVAACPACLHLVPWSGGE